MVKRREIGIAILCFVILGLILVAIMVLAIALNEFLRHTGFYSIMSTMTYVILGASIGISAGFGYVIAQKLFDAFLAK